MSYCKHQLRVSVLWKAVGCPPELIADGEHWAVKVELEQTLIVGEGDTNSPLDMIQCFESVFEGSLARVVKVKSTC